MREPRMLRKCARYSATVVLGVQSSPTSPDCSLADYKAAQESRQRLKLHNGVLITPLCRPSLVPIIRLPGITLSDSAYRPFPPVDHSLFTTLPSMRSIMLVIGN